MKSKAKNRFLEMISLLGKHPHITGHMAASARRAFEAGDYSLVESIFKDARECYPALFGKSPKTSQPERRLPPSLPVKSPRKLLRPPFINISRLGQALHYAWQDDEEGQQQLTFRPDRLALREFPDKLAGLYGHAFNAVSPEGQSSLLDEIRHLGSLLYSGLVPEPVREVIDKSTAGLHLYLDLGAAAFPWEFLWNGSEFISLKLPLTRQISLCRDKSLPRTRAKNMMAAGNSDSGRLALVGEEVRQISEMYRRKSHPADMALDDFTRADLVLWTAGRGILHYAGHSQADARGGNYWLCSDGRVRAGQLASVNRLPKLVFANCCGGAVLGGRMMAQQLLMSGLGNYISPLWKVPDHAALRFALGFHRALLDGQPISQAVFNARKSIGDQAGWAGYLAYCQPDTTITDIM